MFPRGMNSQEDNASRQRTGQYCRVIRRFRDDVQQLLDKTDFRKVGVRLIIPKAKSKAACADGLQQKVSS